jgi:hypothetical protein
MPASLMSLYGCDIRPPYMELRDNASTDGRLPVWLLSSVLFMSEALQLVSRTSHQVQKRSRPFVIGSL